jgi:phosphoglycerate dehydrogenase-like enzyme
MVNVLVVLPLGPELAAGIRAVSPALVIHEATPLLRRLLRGELPVDPDVVRRAEADAAAQLAECEVLIGWARFPERALQWAPRLRWILATSAGVDKLPAAVAARVLLTNGNGLGAEPIAEHVIGGLLMLARGAPQYLRQQTEHRWERSFQAREIAGMTMGVIGMGAIGRAVARRSRALGLRVIGVRRSAGERGPDAQADVVCPPEDLPYVLAESDVIVLATPLTPETRGLISAPQLAAMRSGAYLINIARGPVVDEPALVEALRNGQVGGAALDVFATEPLPAESPLWDLPNLIITPHVAASSDRSRERIQELVCENLRRYIGGEPLRNMVDLSRGY